MKLSRLPGALLMGALAAAGPAFAGDSTAPTVTVGTLQIAGAFARATLPGAMSAGGYFTIINSGADDRLLSVTTPAARISTLHMSQMQGNVMTMAPVTGGIDIRSGATVTLSPSGLHLMFVGLAHPFKEGSTVPVTLTFARAGKVDARLPVLGIAASGPADTAGPAKNDPM